LAIPIQATCSSPGSRRGGKRSQGPPKRPGANVQDSTAGSGKLISRSAGKRAIPYPINRLNGAVHGRPPRPSRQPSPPDSLVACGKKPAASAGDTLTVAATAIPHAEVLEFIKPKLAAEGLKIEIKVFNDYVQPNIQVAEKRMDVNYFETLPYLETFNADKGTNLVPVIGVHIEPIGAYSPKHKSIADLPQGATVAIPNDASTEDRALRLLAKNGVISLKNRARPRLSLKDITSNPKNLKFKELEGATLPRC
jgi:hypothetical protein